MAINNDNNKCHNNYIGLFILIGLIIGAAITNLAQFPYIENQIASPNYPAISSYGTSNLAKISRSKAGPTSEANNSFYLTLSEIAPGAVVIIPKDSTLCIESLYGLGRADYVKELNYDAETFFLELDISYYIMDQYEPRLEIVYRAPELKPVPGPFAFAIESDNPEELIALRREGMWVLTDIALLTTNAIEVLNH